MYGFFSLCVEHSVSYFKGFRHVITNVFHLWTTYEYGLRDPCRKELMKGKCRIFTVLSAQYGHYSWLHVWEYKKSRSAYLFYQNIYYLGPYIVEGVGSQGSKSWNVHLSHTVKLCTLSAVTSQSAIWWNRNNIISICSEYVEEIQIIMNSSLLKRYHS